MCLLMTFSNLDPSRAKCPLERNRDRVSNWKLDGLAREGYYNRRYIWFFPRINWSHRLGFFVIKMILYLEIRGQFACDNRERERGGRDCLGSQIRSFVHQSWIATVGDHLEIVLIIITRFIQRDELSSRERESSSPSIELNSFMEWPPLLIQPRGIVVKHEIYIEGMYFPFRLSDHLDYRQRFTYSLSFWVSVSSV